MAPKDAKVEAIYVDAIYVGFTMAACRRAGLYLVDYSAGS